jgi:hypothetical protein
LPTGIALLVLGVGNGVLSHNKVVEYTERARPSNSKVPLVSFAEFDQLTARTNTALLEPLHRGIADYSDAAAKLDFYRVVATGGRALVMAGLMLVVLAAPWRRPREGRTAPTSPSR